MTIPTTMKAARVHRRGQALSQRDQNKCES